MTIATCRVCRRAFSKDGFAAQSLADPRKCLDCFGRERAFAWRVVDAARGVHVHEYAMDPRD